MKAMYVVNRTTIVVSAIFYAIAALALYSTIRYAVFDELDETLYQRLQELHGTWRDNPQEITEGLIGSYGSHEWVEIHKWNSSIPTTNNVYHTILLPEPHHLQEELEYRRLTAFIPVKDAVYEVSITRPMLEWQEIMTTLNIVVLLALLLLLCTLYAAHAIIFLRLFTPLTTTIEHLAAIRHSRDVRTVLPPSPIDEFSVLNSAINTLLQRIDSAFEEQKEFLQNTSHELQTPLALLRQQTELLLQDPTLPEHALIHIANIQETIARIARLNRALLLIGKIESRQFAVEQKVHPHAILHDILGELQEFIDAKQLVLRTILCSPVPVVIGNRDIFHILFYNLLQNAVKFSPEQGELRIETHTTATEFVTRIGNEGPGIPAERRADVFKRFKKASISWSDSPGLGLSIVKSICDTYGYQCVLDTNNNNYTVFVVTIPLHKQD